MKRRGRKTETAFNILSSLKYRAWDACEDVAMDVLESDRGMREILTRCLAWTPSSSLTRSLSSP